MDHNKFSNVAFVVIGRNEGERLKRSLNAIKKQCPNAKVIYVDSGSTDESVEYANSLAIDVVELDMSIPFTAARARNSGAEKLKEIDQSYEYIQFLDGDCVLEEGWLEEAINFLDDNKAVGICSGRRKEMYPEKSIYNALMDIEWNTPVGEISAVLGDMLVRKQAFEAVDGFDQNIIAAEDDDFCIRVREKGYKVYRIDKQMSKHDANIMKLAQWLKRSKRGGHGYANINYLHGHKEDRHFARHLKSVIFWGGIIPLCSIILLFIDSLACLALIVFYIFMVARLTVKMFKKYNNIKLAIAYSLLIYISKVYELFGVIEFWKNKLLYRKHYLIEYK